MYRRASGGHLRNVLLTASVIVLLGVASAPVVRADTPISQLTTWSGTVGFFSTGAPLAAGAPGSTVVDHLAQPASVAVPGDSVPDDASLQQAFLYWSGTIANDQCAGVTEDTDVDFTPPGAAAPTSVKADTCYCSKQPSNVHYEVQACRADVTSLIKTGGGPLVGTYTVDGFNAQVTGGATDNASFSIVLVFNSPSLPQSRVALYDGLLEMYQNSLTVPLTNVQIDNPPKGSLTWYVLEGDIGGGPGESVTVSGAPSAKTLPLADVVNPVDNPMNHTINTVNPPRTDSIGVDIDRFDIASAMGAGDTSLNMTYSAGDDKWWLVYNIVQVGVFTSELGAGSSKTAILLTDADGNGVPSVGDTIRYTIRLANTGNAAATAQVTDPIPSVARTWQLVSAGGGQDMSTPTTLVVNDVTVPPRAVADVIFDMVLGDAMDGSLLSNTAAYDAGAGGSGMLKAEDLVIRRDGDHDGVFDTQDNCPDAFNPDQTDGDSDGVGDACDPCPMDKDNDPDMDGVCQNVDNCPGVANPDQQDTDGDGVGDACDQCPVDATNDSDMDGICQNVDNCPKLYNPDQLDSDGDGLGDLCDPCPNDKLNQLDAKGICNPHPRTLIHSGCGCSSGADLNLLALGALVFAARLRRRRA